MCFWLRINTTVIVRQKSKTYPISVLRLASDKTQIVSERHREAERERESEREAERDREQR